MKNAATLRLVAGIVMALTCLGLLAAGFLGASLFSMIPTGSLYRYSNSEKYQMADGVIELSGITSVDVNWISGEISVVQGTGDTLTFYEESNHALTSEHKAHYYTENGRLHIQFCRDRIPLRFFRDDHKKLVMELPAGTLNEMDLEVVSADIRISDTSAYTLEIEAVSGDVTLSNLICTDLDYSTVSGSLRANGITSDRFSGGAVSGSMIVTGEVREIDLEAVSGDFDITPGASLRSLDCETVSGRINLTLPESDEGFTAKVDSVSGAFSSDFATIKDGRSYTYLNGGRSFYFTSVSGSIRIMQG